MFSIFDSNYPLRAAKNKHFIEVP